MNIPLIKQFRYDAPVEKAWDALTDAAKLRAWYFPQVQKMEPVVGCRFEFDDHNSAYQKEWIVTQVVECKRFAHSWAYKGYAGSSEVIFDIAAEGTTTRLTVTQTDLDSFPDHAHFNRERFEWGWDTLLGQNLKRLLEA